MEKKNLLRVFIILLTIIILLGVYFLFISTPNLTGNVILREGSSEEIDIKIIQNSLNKFLQITNKGTREYYIEEIHIEGCETYNKITGLSPEETKEIFFNCDSLLNKEIKIRYKKRGESQIFEYKILKE